MFNFLKKKKDTCDICPANNCCNHIPSNEIRTVGVPLCHGDEIHVKYFAQSCLKYIQELIKDFNNG